MGIFRIYPTKSNTIASGFYQNYNAGQNAVTDLWYGGGGTDTAIAKRNSYSRFIVSFDLSELQSKLSSRDINSTNIVSYKLKMKNAIPKDKILEPEYEFDVLEKNIAASFDLICFPLNKDFDEGRGYDLTKEFYLVKQSGNPQITGYSNWNYATSTMAWDAPGVYTDPTGYTYSGSVIESGMTISVLPELTNFTNPVYFNFITTANQFLLNGSASATTINNNISISYASFYSGTTGATGMTFEISNQAVSTGWTFSSSTNPVMSNNTITASTVGNDFYINFSGDSISTQEWYNAVSAYTTSYGISIFGYNTGTTISSGGTQVFTLSANTLSNPVSTQTWLDAMNQTSFSGLGITVSGASLSSYVGDNSFVLSADTAIPNILFYSTQHFDIGNEDISMDITAIVNNWLSSGYTSGGLGVAYRRDYELLSAETRYISSFFTENTNTAFKPYIEVSYNQSFKDDRNDVTNNRVCRLFLYTFSGNSPANYFSAGTVSIKTYSGVDVYTGLTPTQLERGVYYVDVWMSAATKGQQYKDVWQGITFNPGYDQQDYTQFFTVQDNYYFTNSPQVNNYSITTYGIANDSIVNLGDTTRVYCDLRVNYSTNYPKTNYDLQYRMIMNNQEEVVPWTSVNQAVMNKCVSNYFVVETGWLLHNQTYQIQLRVKELGTTRLLPEQITFRVLRNF